MYVFLFSIGRGLVTADLSSRGSTTLKAEGLGPHLSVVPYKKKKNNKSCFFLCVSPILSIVVSVTWVRIPLRELMYTCVCVFFFVFFCFFFAVGRGLITADLSSKETYRMSVRFRNTENWRSCHTSQRRHLVNLFIHNLLEMLIS
jgi:hypothetical protein